MFQWLKRKGSSTADFGKKIVGAEDIENSFKEIKNMASTVLSPKKQIENAKNETFTDARKRLNVTEIDLLKNYKNFVYCFYISFIFTVFCFFGLLYNLFVNQQFISSIAILAILLLCIANSFKFSFRSFQIKHQKLCSVNEWWSRANEWFPAIPK